MSIDIDWSKLIEDQVLETNLRDFLDDQFCRLPLPPFIQSLRVSSLRLGTKPPELTIRHISDPFPEFYADEVGYEEYGEGEYTGDSQVNLEGQQSGGSLGGSQLGLDDTANQTIPEVHVDPLPAIERICKSMGAKNRDTNTSTVNMADDTKVGTGEDTIGSPFDFQAIVELAYKGDMELGVNATLLVNYPSPNFISLPLSFQVSSIDIHSLAVVAVIPNRISISVLCDIDSNDQMSSDSVKVVKGMKIQSSIGDDSENGAVLRNVGRVEKFILEQLRKVIRDELVWPGWITLEV